MNDVSSMLWHPYVLLLLAIICIYFHLRRKLIIIKSYFKSLFVLGTTLISKDTSTKKIIMNSLGAVMGIGNIIGVATAIIMGGKGTIFYMALSGILVTALKYEEIYNAIKYSGGTPIYIRKITRSKCLSLIYTFLLLISSLVMGNMVVSKTTSDLLYLVLDVPSNISAILMAVILFILIVFNYQSVMEYNEILVPYMIGLFGLVSIYICLSNFELFISSVSSILKEAFNKEAFIYGNGYSMLRYGIARGFFSNEAGFGSSTLLHHKGKLSAHDEAMMGVHEVIIDTNIMCVVVGVILIMSKVYHENAVMYVLLAFNKLLPNYGISFILIMILFFGLAAMLGWYLIGKECLLILKGNKGCEYLYLFMFVSLIVVANIVNLEMIFSYSDLLNALMMWINIYTLIKTK